MVYEEGRVGCVWWGGVGFWGGSGGGVQGDVREDWMKWGGHLSFYFDFFNHCFNNKKIINKQN